jgi:hypothetical protein
MNQTRTEETLEGITDEGLFERLATAILREAEPRYRGLVHPGVNAAGKTVKSPVDGITFLEGSDAPHMLIVHHTTTARDDLGKKWLHDPATVTTRKGGKPTAPPGDLIKTIAIVEDQRKTMSPLDATLVLTTNREPDEGTVRSVQAAAAPHRLTIDLWHRSRLAHFLDHDPQGQWLRRSFLGVKPERLSLAWLGELSKKSLAIYSPPDREDAWVMRELDVALGSTPSRLVTFVVAPSGLGKSIACYKQLVPRHRGFDRLIFDYFRTGKSSGATRSSMLRGTPG